MGNLLNNTLPVMYEYKNLIFFNFASRLSLGNNVAVVLYNIPQKTDFLYGSAYIDYLWNGLMNSISIENPATFSIDLLNHFFNDKNKGVVESYIGQYLHKLSNMTQTLSSEQKEIIIKKLDVLTSNVKENIFL